MRAWASQLAGGIAASLLASSAAATPLFMGLGDLPGGRFESAAFAVSADGSVVVGRGTVLAVVIQLGPNPKNIPEVFRWTRTTGMVNLGFRFACAGFAQPADVSADGSVIVGSAGSCNPEAWAWSADSGARILAAGGTGYYYADSARAVSADGTAIVGWAQGLETEQEAVLWRDTLGDGFGEEDPFVLLGGLEPNDETKAFAISADGLSVLGTSGPRSHYLEDEVFRWSAADGVVSLGFFAGDRPVASPDLSFVAGEVYTPDDENPGFLRSDAFRWSEAGGFELLGGPPGTMTPTAISPDGSFIFGRTWTGSDLEAFMWDEGNRMRLLSEALVASYGLDLTGWTLTDVADISADGSTIVGSGINPNGDPEAWIAVIPEPASGALLCAAVGVLVVARGRMQRR